MDLEKERREWEAEALRTPLIEGTTVESAGAEGVHCEWVRAAGAARDKVLLLVHGGGFNAGSCITHRDMAARLSLASGVSVLVADYRLAPEHPFPEGLYDILAVYRWLVNSGYEPKKIAVGGDSAGGNLALAALISLRDSGDLLPAALVLMSAWLDLTLTGESIMSREGADELVTKVDLLRARGYYIGSDVGADRLMSPLFADLRGLPRILIHVGDTELLLSDSERLAEKAQSAGVDASLKVWPGRGHVFHALASTMPDAQQALDEIGVFVREKVDSRDGGA